MLRIGVHDDVNNIVIKDALTEESNKGVIINEFNTLYKGMRVTEEIIETDEQRKRRLLNS